VNSREIRLGLYERSAQDLRAILNQYATLNMRTSTGYGGGRHVDTTEQDIDDIQSRLANYERLISDLKRPA
jgi:hypothetical protein